jgi:VanZ family protein
LAEGTPHRFVRYWLPVLVYMILIFTLSSIPRLGPPFHFPNSDKMVHVMEYSILGFLLTRALRTLSPLHAAMAAGLVALICGSTIGALDEIYQKGTPGRESSAFDWMADTLGLILAFLLYTWNARRRLAVVPARRSEP